MTIQYRSDITIVGVSELGFYLCEQHLLKPLFLSKIWKAQPMHFKHIFFSLLKHMLSLCCKDSYMNWGKFALCKANWV